MATIGQQFKAARESKGVSEAEAAKATKILTKLVVAMEADDFSAMAAPTYAKGFIRLYADYLELDAEMLVSEYTKHNGSGPRKRIDETSQLEKNRQSGRIFPTRSNKQKTQATGRTWLKKISLLKNLPLGPLKDIRIAAAAIAGLLVLAVFIGSISTCIRKKTPAAPLETQAIAPAKMLLDEPLPDLYLTGPDQIETN